MKKMIKTLLSVVTLLSLDAFAITVTELTQSELNEVFRKCSLSNPNSTVRRLTAEKFLAKAEKTAFEAQKLAVKEKKSGYEKRAKKLKQKAKTLSAMCTDLRRNKKLETGRYTDAQLDTLFNQHNKLIAFMDLDALSAAWRGIGKSAKNTGSFLSKNKGSVAIATTMTIASAAMFVLGYVAKGKDWHIPILKNYFS